MALLWDRLDLGHRRWLRGREIALGRLPFPLHEPHLRPDVHRDRRPVHRLRGHLGLEGLYASGGATDLAFSVERWASAALRERARLRWCSRSSAVLFAGILVYRLSRRRRKKPAADTRARRPLWSYSCPTGSMTRDGLRLREDDLRPGRVGRAARDRLDHAVHPPRRRYPPRHLPSRLRGRRPGRRTTRATPSSSGPRAAARPPRTSAPSASPSSARQTKRRSGAASPSATTRRRRWSSAPSPASG